MRPEAALEKQIERYRQMTGEERCSRVHEESEKRNEEFQREALRLLHRMLDRLNRNPNSKN